MRMRPGDKGSNPIFWKLDANLMGTDWHLPFFVRLKRDILQKKSRARRLKSKEETPDDALGGGHGKRPAVARDLVRSCG